MTLDEKTTADKRTVLRMIPYGLYVVTAKDSAGTFNGFTANWVTQAGFEPPMVAVGIANDSYTLTLIQSSKRFGLSLFEDGSRDLVRQLARPHAKFPEKFDGVALKETANGTPVLAVALGYLELALRGELEYGADHRIIVGEVIDAGVYREGDIQTMQAAGMRYSG